MPSANALLVARVPHDRRGTAFGLTGTAASASNMVGPVSGATITAQWGMRSVFLATGVLYLFSFGWAALGLRRSRRQAELDGAKARPAATQAQTEEDAPEAKESSMRR
jgi:DHA1 family multidrug resistance protein-like MFS transporter